MSEGKGEFWFQVGKGQFEIIPLADITVWNKPIPAVQISKDIPVTHVIEKYSYDKAIEAIREAQKNWCIIPICDCPLCRVLKELSE